MVKDTVTRGIELNLLEITPIGKGVLAHEYKCKDEFIKIVKYLLSLNKEERKINYIRDEKVIYLDMANYNEENNTLKLSFISAKYNQRKSVIDTITLTDRSVLKKQNDGDKEYTNLVVAFCKRKNEAIAAVEMNYLGLKYSKIVAYINDIIIKYSEQAGWGRNYIFEYRIIVNSDFENALRQTRKINLVKLYIDKQNLCNDEFKELTGRSDVRDELEIAFKAAKGQSIALSPILECYYRKIKKDKINRITVDADYNKGPIRLDTENMKTKKYVDVRKSKITDEIDKESIFKELLSTVLESRSNN